MKHIFLIGAKSMGIYGGYETFVNKLTEYHADKKDIKYHVAVKKNGIGSGVPDEVTRIDNSTFEFHNAECFEINVPEKIGPAQAIYYDCASLMHSISIIKNNKIHNPIIYIMTCRIGPFFNYYARKIHKLGGKIYLNPDGHEWLRSKWRKPIKLYWKYSEKIMVRGSDVIVCDSRSIEDYVKKTYDVNNTVFIAYGAETRKSICSNERYEQWLNKKGLKINNYYLIVGRFVPENNYETMIYEYMKSKTCKDLAIICNRNDALLAELERKLHFSLDKRIKFVDTVYDQILLKKIREEAYGYLHGHEVGGTNPSLLESLGSTNLNLLLKVDFNEEVAKDAALYWTKEDGCLSELINYCESIDREYWGKSAKQRISDAYSWELICDKYEELWERTFL